MASPRLANAAPLRDRTPILAVALFALLAITPAASANTGTALIWLGCFQLIFGNMLIALFEAAILTKMLHAPYRRTFRWLFYANYVSMGAGVLLSIAIDSIGHRLYPADVSVIIAGRWMLIGAVVLAFVLTVLIEWPFAHRAAKKSERFYSPKRSFAANLVAQTASYAIVVLLYAGSSRISFITQVDVVPPESLAGAPRDIAIYHMTPDRQTVRRIDLASGATEEVATVPPGAESPALEVEHKEAGEWSIWLNVGEDADRFRVDDGAIAEVATVWTWEGERDLRVSVDPFFRTASFQPQTDCAVEVFALNSFGVDLIIQERESRRRMLHLAFETPLVHWRLAAPTLINDRFLLIQLEDQLHLIDIETHEIAYLAPGVWPVVVREQHPASDD